MFSWGKFGCFADGRLVLGEGSGWLAGNLKSASVHVVEPDRRSGGSGFGGEFGRVRDSLCCSNFETFFGILYFGIFKDVRENVWGKKHV